MCPDTRTRDKRRRGFQVLTNEKDADGTLDTQGHAGNLDEYDDHSTLYSVSPMDIACGT
jgi:hypothetical protein